MKRLTKIYPGHGTVKTLVLVYAIFVVIFAIPSGIFAMIAEGWRKGLFFLFVLPVLYILFSTLMIWLTVIIYNWVAGYTGGITVELSDSDAVKRE